VKRLTISDTVVKFRRIKKRTVVYLLLVKQCYHWRLLTLLSCNGVSAAVLSVLALQNQSH
jgi:hypothetical protein